MEGVEGCKYASLGAIRVRLREAQVRLGNVSRFVGGQCMPPLVGSWDGHDGGLPLEGWRASRAGELVKKELLACLLWLPAGAVQGPR